MQQVIVKKWPSLSIVCNACAITGTVGVKSSLKQAGLIKGTQAPASTARTAIFSSSVLTKTCSKQPELFAASITQ